jgi:hypothetical protein
MNIFKKFWLWLKGCRIKNTGYELIRITGEDYIQIQYSWGPECIGSPAELKIDPHGAILVGPFPTQYFGKTMYIDAGKNKVEHIDILRML